VARQDLPSNWIPRRVDRLVLAGYLLAGRGFLAIAFMLSITTTITSFLVQLFFELLNGGCSFWVRAGPWVRANFSRGSGFV